MFDPIKSRENARIVSAIAQIAQRRGQHMPVAIIQRDRRSTDLARPYDLIVSHIAEIVGLETFRACGRTDDVVPEAEARMDASEEDFILLIDADHSGTLTLADLVVAADVRQDDQRYGGVLILTSEPPYDIAGRVMTALGASTERLIL